MASRDFGSWVEVVGARIGARAAEEVGAWGEGVGCAGVVLGAAEVGGVFVVEGGGPLAA